MITVLAKSVSLIHLIYVTIFISGAIAIQVATELPAKLEDILKKTNVTVVNDLLNNSRRIVNGIEAHANRPYMVYLKLPANNPKYKDYRSWLCGGVIVHEEYILTSAACIEDAKHFYVVSGTFKHRAEDDHYNNACIKNGAKKAIWKCIPRNYIFDGHENDNIRWMSNDIAVVKVEDEFDFYRRIRGCDFIPRPICYNNQSSKLENPGTVATIAGWGSLEKYNEDSYPQDLLESDVKVITKNRCKSRWGKRYHHIIDNYMICTKDLILDPSEVCSEKYVDCTDILYSDFESIDVEMKTRRVVDPDKLVLHSAYHNTSARKQAGYNPTGGFCESHTQTGVVRSRRRNNKTQELTLASSRADHTSALEDASVVCFVPIENDHGGPLIYGDGVNAVVIGIISACLVKERTNKCYGPFLYTSVFKNRVLINCAIYKDMAQDCNKLFRSSITHTEVEMSWVDHPDGPAKNEIAKARRNKENATQISDDKKQAPEANDPNDKAEQHGGVIVRALRGKNSTAN